MCRQTLQPEPAGAEDASPTKSTASELGAAAIQEALGNRVRMVRAPHRSGTTNGRGHRRPRPASKCSGSSTPSSVQRCDFARRIPRNRCRRRLRADVELAAPHQQHRESSTRCHEDFDMNPLRRHVQGRERIFHVCHEAIWAAEIDIRLSRDADLLQDRSRQVTGRLEILAHLIWPAIANIAAAVGEREHEVADFGCKWMKPPVAGRVRLAVSSQPPPAYAASPELVSPRSPH